MTVGGVRQMYRFINGRIPIVRVLFIAELLAEDSLVRFPHTIILSG